MEFRFLLAELMAERNLTQGKLVEDTGLSPVTVNHWYHGHTLRPDLKVAKKLMKYFGLTRLDQLIRTEVSP